MTVILNGYPGAEGRDGKRNLTRKSLVKFQSTLGLKGRKAEFFENLVFFNQATTISERNIYYEKILKVRARSGLRKLEESQFQLFSDWRHIVIRELVALKGFLPDPWWILRKLGKGITAKQVEESPRPPPPRIWRPGRMPGHLES